MDSYKNLFNRNAGYINDITQKKIHDIHILIAGCGLGSQIAVAAVRMGFAKFLLIDGDTVSAPNLNRQAYNFFQIGKNKSIALKENILAINPDCTVTAIDHHLNSQTLSPIKNVDLIVDTINFLDLRSILLLHETAEQKKIKLISGMSVGWGACLIYFPNDRDEKRQFRKLFFALKNHIDPQVITAMDKAFQSMSDGMPCPAPQVISGATTLASMVCATLYKILPQESVPTGPNLVILDLVKLVSTPAINLQKELKF